MTLRIALLLFIIIIGRYVFPSVDLFLVAFYTLFTLDHNRQNRTITEFILLSFLYSFLRDPIVGLFPFVFIITSTLFYLVVRRVPKSGTVLSFLSILFITLTTVSYASLSHVLQQKSLFFFPESAMMGVATSVITIFLIIFINTRKKRI